MDKVVYDYDGYIKLNPETGEVEVIDPNGRVKSLASTNNAKGIRFMRARIKLYQMSSQETETARWVFNKMGQ